MDDGRLEQQRQPGTDATGKRLIRPFPKGFTRSGGLSQDFGPGAGDSVGESVGVSELPSPGTDSTRSNASGNNGRGGFTPTTPRRIESTPRQSIRGIRDSAGDNPSYAIGTTSTDGTEDSRAGNGISSVDEGLSQQGIGIETKSSLLNLPETISIEPTAMLQRELKKAVEQEPEQAPIMVEERPQPIMRPSTPARPTPLPQKKSETVKPLVAYKFSKEVKEQLTEWFVWASKGMDLGVDYGLGVDTSLVPLWELNEEEAGVFVRILERRAGRSEMIRDTVVPKILESRDYIEAGIILAPRFITTVQTIVEQGGPKPHIRKMGDANGQANGE